VLDALHLACAARHDASLVTADLAMGRAAKRLGVAVRRFAA
jgi:predicted nucleic acid-binding protein